MRRFILSLVLIFVLVLVLVCSAAGCTADTKSNGVPTPDKLVPPRN